VNDRSAAWAASSNCRSSFGLTPLSPSATFRAHSTYSILRLTDQSAGGLAAIARRLLVLSASLSSLARVLLPAAPSIFVRFNILPEVKAQYDNATNSKPLLFSGKQEAFRIGPEATVLFNVVPNAGLPDFMDRISAKITYRSQTEFYSHRQLNWFDTSLTYDLDQQGYFALTATYQNGSIDETGQQANVYKVALSGKTCANLSTASAC
jgi:hypothetical protein